MISITQTGGIREEDAEEDIWMLEEGNYSTLVKKMHNKDSDDL